MLATSFLTLAKNPRPHEKPLPVEDIEALARATDDALALIPSSKRRSCDDQRLERLRRKLDEAIDEVGTSAFVRLNYLSPKD